MRHLLKDRYDQNEFIIPSFNKNINGSLDKYFVGLEIIEQNKNVSLEASWGFDFFSKRDTIPGRRNKTGTIIQIEDIMNYSLNKIAVYGSPGTGKTTFCKKIVYDFYKNSKFNDLFDDIIWIQLRRLKEKTLRGEDFKTIDELVADSFRINENMLTFERCLFILDGWDEIHDLNEGNVVKNLLKEIISEYKIIITSRPYADLTHVIQHADQVIEISGFDDFNVRKFIKNVLNSGSKLNMKAEAEILEFLSGSTISDMMSIPILLDIFLFTWEEIVVTQVSKLTITKLYELIVLKLWNEFIENERPHYRQQIGYDNQNLKSVITVPMFDKSFSLSKIACKSFERGDLLFSYLEIEGDNECKDALLKSRFLNGIDVSEGNVELKRYEFIHLTFCEFFTALNYVHHKTLKEFRQIVGQYKYNITYRIVFGFISGLLSSGTHSFTKDNNIKYSNQEMLNIFFDCLESEPIDLIRSYHNILTATCLNECGHALDEKRVTEICKDLCDTHIQKLPKITSLAIVKSMVKNKINLTKFIGLRLTNLSDQFFLESDFAAIDAWSKTNILCSQVSFNEASKAKLKELLVDVNNGEIFNFFSNNCMRSPDFFLIYIIENFKTLVQKYKIITRLQLIKMTLKDCRSVCAYLEPIVSELDSIPDIIRKIICNSNLEIVYFIFLRNSYEFMEQFIIILPTLLDECSNSIIFISRILFVIAFCNISSLVILNKFMNIMDTFEELIPLVVRIIFHLYYNKWLPYSVALRLIKYLQKEDESMEDHLDNRFIEICTKYPTIFRSNNMKFSMYELVCEGLVHSYFQPKLLDSIIDRLCTGEQRFDDDMSYFLSKRSLTISQITKFIETNEIIFEEKYWVLRCHTHHKDVTAFLTRNACDMFAVDDASELYMKIDKDFSENERRELLNHSTGYQRYHIEQTTATLEEINNKINRMIENEHEVFEACKKYCEDLCFETFQYSVDGITIQNLYELFESAFKLSYLSLNQRAMHITDRILHMSKNQFAVDLEQMIDNFWNYETSINVLDENFFQNLSNDVLGSYYFKILNKKMQSISKASLIKWISPLNIKHLLTFLIYEITTFKHALYIQPSLPNLYRLHSFNCQSQELGIEEINFIYEFKPIQKFLDHSCRQVRKNSVSDYFTMDQCQCFIIQVNEAEKLDEISDKQYHVKSQCDLFFNGPKAKDVIELFKMLYNQKILLTTSTHFDMWWSTFYAYQLNFHSFIDVNFGPYHINLSDKNITDKFVALNLEKFLVDNKKNVHVLILSNNNITINGFERLIKSVKESEVRHLFLDGNHIYFDKQRFDKFKTLITDTSLQLLTLDLSCNFIATEWVHKLNSLNGDNFTNTKVKYCLINNCRVIYQRNLPQSHLGFSPAIDFIAEMEAKVVPLKITQERGCVGHVCKKQDFGYSGHVLLFIERMFNGQLEVKTAELFQDKNANNLCKVVIKNVDPFVDHENDGGFTTECLRNRLLLYNIPKRASFPNETIEKLLEDIKNSQDKDNFYEYSIATGNEFENRNNCIKWANDIMRPYVNFEILQLKIPWFYKSSSKKFVLRSLQFIILILIFTHWYDILALLIRL